MPIRPSTAQPFTWFRGTNSRYIITMDYVRRFIPKGSIITDLGGENEFADDMRDAGYLVATTSDTDLDQIYAITHSEYVTSFEVFEHLLNPYMLLQTLTPGTKLLCSVPLNVWFSREHWLDDDRRQHYHEFTERQFHKLLHKTGFTIQMSKKHRIVKSVGIRQFLRMFWHSYLFVYAEKEVK